MFKFKPLFAILVFYYSITNQYELSTYKNTHISPPPPHPVPEDEEAGPGGAEVFALSLTRHTSKCWLVLRSYLMFLFLMLIELWAKLTSLQMQEWNLRFPPSICRGSLSDRRPCCLALSQHGRRLLWDQEENLSRLVWWTGFATKSWGGYLVIFAIKGNNRRCFFSVMFTGCSHT